MPNPVNRQPLAINHPKNIIIGPAHPLRGGIADFNEALCREFVEAGAQSSIISFSLQYPRMLFPGKTQYSNDPAPDDIAIHTVINSVNPLTWFKAARLVKQQQPDYVIIRYWLPFMGPCLGTIARSIRKNGKTKVIALTDNVIPHESRPGDKLFTRYFLKGCDGFVTLSRQVMDDLGKFVQHPKAAYHPHPIYDIFGQAVSKQEAYRFLGLEQGRYILFFGFVRKYKGLDLLLEAMGDERVKKLGVKLIVAGEFYEETGPYEEQVKRLELEDHVIVKDHFIPREEARYYFCAADMVVQPYRTATQSGITQVAYNFERPMLVTNVGGLEEVVPHHKAGYVVDVSPKAIADSIVHFYEHNMEAQFSEGAKAEKERFSWKSMVDCIESLYREL